MKDVKVFLASSIDELKLDSLEIGDYLRELDEIHEKYGVRIRLEKFEADDDATLQSEDQSAYDEMVKDSDMVFFLFFESAKESTINEFKLALETYAANKEKPKIFVYFKQLGGMNPTQELQDFIAYLGGEIKHYYGTYDHIDSLKLGMIMQMKHAGAINGELSFEDGQALLNGKPLLSLDNIPLVLGNENMQALKNEYVELEKRYNELRDKRDANPDDEEIDDEYRDVAYKRGQVQDAIKQAENSIFNLADNMYERTAEGLLTKRQIEAYRYLQQGNYKAASAVLDLEVLMKDIEHTQALGKGLNERYQAHVNELLDKISIDTTMAKTAEAWHEIKKLYKKAADLEEESNLPRKATLGYARYLIGQKQFKEGLEIAEKLERYYFGLERDTPVATLAEIYVVLNHIYVENKQYDKATKHGLKAIKIYERLAKEDPGKYLQGLAAAYNNMGWQHFNNNNNDEAGKYFSKSQEICEQLVAKSPDNFVYTYELAFAYQNMAAYFSRKHKFKKSEKMSLKALALYEQVPAAKLNEFGKLTLARIYTSLAGDYSRKALLSPFSHKRIIEEVKHCYEKAGKLYANLIASNPTKYMLNYAPSLQAYGAFLNFYDLHEDALIPLKKAFEIYSRLVKIDPVAHEFIYGVVCCELGIALLTTDQKNEARFYADIAIPILGKHQLKFKDITIKMNFYKLQSAFPDIKYADSEISANSVNREDVTSEAHQRTAEENSEEHENMLVSAYDELGSQYKSVAQKAQIEIKITDYESAIKEQEKLVEKDPENYESKLADTYQMLWRAQIDLGKYEESVKTNEKEMILAEKLVKKDPKNYGQKWATAHHELAFSLLYLKRYDESVEIYKEAIRLGEKLVDENPEDRYKSNLVNSYDGIAKAYFDARLYEESGNYYQKALKMRECLSEKDSEAHKTKIASYYGVLGTVHYIGKRYEDAVGFRLQAIEKYEKLVEEGKRESINSLALQLKSLGDCYEKLERFDDAENAFNKAVELLIRPEIEKAEFDIESLADMYQKLAAIYKSSKRLSESESMHQKAIEIYEKLIDKNIDRYGSKLVLLYNGLGNIHYSSKQYDKCGEMYQKAVDLRERLYARNPEEHESSLAIDYHNLGNYYKNTNQIDDAISVYSKAVEILKSLAKKDPKKYEAELALKLCNLGNFCYDKDRFEKAEAALLEAIKIRKYMAESDPSAFETDTELAYCQHYLADVYESMKQFEKAEALYLDAIKILKAFTEKNPDASKSKLALSYHNLGYLYVNMQRIEDSIAVLSKAVKIRKQLVENDYKSSDVGLAVSCMLLGRNLYNSKKYKEAAEIFSTAVESRTRLAKENPEKYEDSLASAYFWLGYAYRYSGKTDDAKEALQKALEIYERIGATNENHKDSAEKIKSAIKELSA